MEATEHAVTRLTETHTEHTEAGPVEWPPLLEWLETRVTEIVGRKGGTAAGAGIPLNTDALELLQYIDRQLKLMLAAFGLVSGGDRVTDAQYVWRLATTERKGGRMDDTQWERITGELQDWVIRIEAEDDRPRKMELTVPCPRCETRWVMDDEGNRVAAVVVEFSPGRAPIAECRVKECVDDHGIRSTWAGWDAVARLGFTVGAQQNLEVLTACGIDAPENLIRR